MVSTQAFRLELICFIEANLLLQRIVKALPYKLLLVQKDSRPFWCFVFLSRCLIYKVHAAKLTAGFQCTTFRSPCQELFSFIRRELLVVPRRPRQAT